MGIPETVDAQRDFSAGEIDVVLKRSEDAEVYKRGLRQCRNYRILNSRKLSNRFGRTALFIDGPRVEEVLMSSGNVFKLIFGNGYLRVRDSNGAIVFNSTKKGDGVTNIPWTTASVKNIVWCVYKSSIYIFYGDDVPTNVPQILSWDGVSTWSLATFSFAVLGSHSQEPFYRIAALGITLQPSGTSGAVNLTFSANVLTPAMIGTRIRFAGRQILITGVTSGTLGTGTCQELLFTGDDVSIGVGTGDFTISPNVGEEVIGATTGQKGIFTGAITSTFGHFQLISVPNAYGIEELVAPIGNVGTVVSQSFVNPVAITVWDQSVMNNFQGWPKSGFVDQNRLGMCDIPAVPGGIAYSAIGDLTNFDVNAATASAAIFELVPDKAHVLYVQSGAESSEFVFCDKAVYYIPITPANPLSAQTGISFQLLSSDSCASVQPRLIQEYIVFASSHSINAITATGAYNRPFEVRHLSTWHDHLFNDPIAIAGPHAIDINFPERYVYVLNSDGTLAVGKIFVEDGQLKDVPGWVPENGNGFVTWVSARLSDVIFTTTYQVTPGSITPTPFSGDVLASGLGDVLISAGGAVLVPDPAIIVPAVTVIIAELRAFNQYLDAAMLYNAVPTALTPPLGKGPLWWLASGSCFVMDQGTRPLGTYQIDNNGFLVPQNFGGEDLTSAQLVVGQSWTAIVEPFVPGASPGQDFKQRMLRRRVARFGVYVQNSSGFLLMRLFSGPLRPGGPALGDTINTRRVPTYNQDDDATLPPPLREGAEFWRPSGRSYDPRNAIGKDTPGPLNILEINQEVSV